MHKYVSYTCGDIVPYSQMSFFSKPSSCSLFILLREQLTCSPALNFLSSLLHLIHWKNGLLSLSSLSFWFNFEREMKDLDFLWQETRPVSITRHLFFQGAMLGVFISPLKVTLDDGLRIILKEALYRAPSQPPLDGLFFWLWWQETSGTSLFSRLSI